MTTFDDRGKGFEAKYKRDQELQFKVMARRNMLLGLWAAEKMGVSGADAETYSKEVVVSDFDRQATKTCLKKFTETSKPRVLACQRQMSARKWNAYSMLPANKSRQKSSRTPARR